MIKLEQHILKNLNKQSLDSKINEHIGVVLTGNRSVFVVLPFEKYIDGEKIVQINMDANKCDKILTRDEFFKEIDKDEIQA